MARPRLAGSIATGIGCAVLAAAIGITWYGVNGWNKLEAALSPSLEQDLSVQMHAPSPVPPAVVISLIAAAVLALLVRALPSRGFEHLSLPAVLIGPAVLWAFVALQWLSRAAGAHVFSEVDMLVFSWSEFAAASLVLLFPWAVVAAVVATRD